MLSVRVCLDSFFTNPRSKVSLCFDALRYDLFVVLMGVQVQNFNVELFSDTIKHRNLKLSRVVVCNEGVPNNAQFGYLS